MRILFVSPGLPAPISGGRSRVYHLARNLTERHEVTVLSFVQPAEADQVPQAQECCARLELVPYAGFVPSGGWANRLRGWGRILFDARPASARTWPVDSMRGSLRKLLHAQPFDVIVLEHLPLAELVSEAVGVPVILVEHNVESDIARQAARLAGNPVHRLRDWLSWRKLFAFEQEWLRRFRVVVSVSELDAEQLRSMSPGTVVRVVPNGVDADGFRRPGLARDRASLLFFGTLSYRPNQDGLAWFCREVWPTIRRARPDAELRVVGSNQAGDLRQLAAVPGVRLLGFVPDIRDVLWRAELTVVPLRFGGGTRLKILEALAAALPVVSTSLGAAGLNLVPGEHLLVADGPGAFAGSVLECMASEDLRRRLADAGRKAVAERYDWRSIAVELESACAQAIRLGSGGSGACA